MLTKVDLAEQNDANPSRVGIVLFLHRNPQPEVDLFLSHLSLAFQFALCAAI